MPLRRSRPRIIALVTTVIVTVVLAGSLAARAYVGDDDGAKRTPTQTLPRVTQ